MFALALKSSTKQAVQRKAHNQDEWNASQTPADMEKSIADFADQTISEALYNLTDWENGIKAAAAANPEANYSASLEMCAALRAAFEAAKL